MPLVTENLGTRVVRITLDHRVPGRVPGQTGWMADEELTRIAARLAGYGAIAKKWGQYSVRISDRIALAEFGDSDEELSFASDVLIGNPLRGVASNLDDPRVVAVIQKAKDDQLFDD